MSTIAEVKAELDELTGILEERYTMDFEDHTGPAKMVLCTWSQAPDGSTYKCGWTGRMSKYMKHLKAHHGGEEYTVPEAGIPIEED